MNIQELSFIEDINSGVIFKKINEFSNGFSQAFTEFCQKVTKLEEKGPTPPSKKKPFNQNKSISKSLFINEFEMCIHNKIVQKYLRKCTENLIIFIGEVEKIFEAYSEEIQSFSDKFLDKNNFMKEYDEY